MERYDLAKEGGHTEHRILHHKDKTGEVIQRDPRWTGKKESEY